MSEEHRQHLSEAKKGEKNYMVKKCIFDGKTFGCIKDAWRYAKDYCGYEYGYVKFRKHIKG